MAEGKILIVDDEESMCQFLSIMLKREGYDVTAVTTGAEALKSMQRDPADAVITDIQMPKMDGLQVLAGVKAVDPGVPVIIMTAYASKQTAIEAVNRASRPSLRSMKIFLPTWEYFASRNSDDTIICRLRERTSRAAVSSPESSARRWCAIRKSVSLALSREAFMR
jgi:CheY-like chemotaxis protein